VEENRRFEDISFNGELIETGEDILNYFSIELKFLPVAKRLEKIKSRLTAKLDILIRERIEEMVIEVANTGEYPNASEIRARSIFIVRGEAASSKNKIMSMTELNLVECYKGFLSYRADKEYANSTQIPGDVKGISNYTNELFNNAKIFYEDIAPLLLLNGLLFGFPNMQHIRHVIIDEVQDYTPVQFELFKLLFGCCNMTLLGDTNQAISLFTEPCSNNTIMEVVGSDASITVQLSKSYRSTRQIAEFCKNLIHGDCNTDYINRDGELPKVICSLNKEALYALIAEDIKVLKLDGAQSIAIILRTEAECKDAYDSFSQITELSLITADRQELFAGTVVIPSYLSKGLEFDVVFVLCMNPSMYENKEEVNLVYTICTRALHKLHIYCLGGFPGFVKDIGTEFYKYSSCEY
jgi:DNA helicase-2/ATP-dependent DNA helicase PcrA